VLPRRAGKFDSRVVEPGPPPILTPAGIVLVYNGADDKLVYRTGVAVFDRTDPRKLISRTDVPVFAPEKEWEQAGQVPNVVFVEGLVKWGDKFLFYYGGADKYIGVAEADETVNWYYSKEKARIIRFIQTRSENTMKVEIVHCPT
jgi:predicted GH43/DUF377 family glycosyl hydrolase